MSNLVCLNTLDGIPSGCQTENPFTTIKGGILEVPNKSFSSYANFADETQWKTRIANKELFPILDVIEIEPVNVEDGFYDAPDGERIFLYEGQRGYILKVKYELARHKVLRSYSGLNWKMYKYDKRNNLMGTTPDGTVVEGFDLSLFYVSKIDNNVGADTPAFTMIHIQERIVDEFDSQGLYLTPTFLMQKLPAVTKVVATPGAISTFVFDVVVDYQDSSGLQNDGTSRSKAITGLLIGDFEVIDQTGTIITPSSITESATTPGTYTVTTAAMTSGSIQVIPSATSLFESAVAAVS